MIITKRIIVYCRRCGEEIPGRISGGYNLINSLCYNCKMDKKKDYYIKNRDKILKLRREKRYEKKKNEILSKEKTGGTEIEKLKE